VKTLNIHHHHHVNIKCKHSAVTDGREQLLIECKQIEAYLGKSGERHEGANPQSPGPSAQQPTASGRRQTAEI